MSVFSRFLARRRLWLFFLVMGLVVASALLVPHININTDMTKYLPDEYPMKRGLDIVREQIPGMEEQISSLGASFGNGADLMPTDLPRTLAIGVSLLFVVLLVMCSSLMEVVLFLITAICAVVLNMGTNALRESVSMITNTLTPVLQMVLSMDYCIILMNRYRQERLNGLIPSDAIHIALKGSAPAILSSAFTTIVSLLMLTFIKLKIGSDLGYVLAKGVAFSLLCCFTVLPTLIVWADKQVIFKVKKTPKFPAATVSRFQARFKVPLAVLFVLVVALAFWLQGRTPINFAPTWESKASEQSQDSNPMLLLYETGYEDALPRLLEELEADPRVMQTISYPTTLGKQCTVGQMREMMSGLATDSIPEELLRMVYYARSHPKIDGRLSFNEIQEAAESLAASGQMPEGMNFDDMVANLTRQMESEPEEPLTAETVQMPEPDTSAVVQVITEEEPPVTADSLEVVPAISEAEVAPDVQQEAGITYEDVTRQRTAAEMAEIMGVEKKQVNMVFRLAGKTGSTMSMAEFYAFVRDKILTNKRYSAMVPKDMKQKFVDAGEQMEKILAAGPVEEPPQDVLAEVTTEPATADSVAIVPAPDTVLMAEAPVAPVAAVSEPEPAPVVVEPSPLDKLIDMMVSGWRYSSSSVHSALSAAGVPVTRDDIDMLYLYALSRRDFDPEQTMTPQELVYYVADSLMQKPSVQRIVPEQIRSAVDSARGVIADNAGMLRGEKYSFALVSTSYPQESDSTFAFVASANAAADSLLGGAHYWIGESEMYKELKDAFPSELLLLTILTVLAIYLIVAITFRSLLIPVPLVLSVLTGVYINVIVSGIGGGQMYYLAYLIIQGILMGAAIDYSILFTSYFRSARKTEDVQHSIQTAFEGSSHSVLTSGLILILVPMVMSFVMSDAMINSILKSLSIGALSSVMIILFLLPAVLALLSGKPARQKNESR
ncbi:MAG: MMPL family transporter [Bacteroidales bacterium]|nr:MMPL family transporter [Bacteroidales bacterium]